ncbi:hypothetical protein EV207_10763 [Scopulibacillus darangshiensis]|uniref:SHOCT domain-containing protein n=1 Tax=Scopulibacillus darangshiensis TaxID=442528 RepID=A0A4R2P553_9BACL|nr:SHOCT domain-containing protein [Scopulibacillus darangshiensis]TCP29969.1 hypothetical protein EV207_10763 [Scopulibacillus darangshiensis]
MYWGHPFFPPIGFFFIILFIGLVISNIMLWRRRGRACRRYNGNTAEFMLKKRLVNGEIDEEEYLRLKNVLEQ